MYLTIFVQPSHDIEWVQPAGSKLERQCCKLTTLESYQHRLPAFAFGSDAAGSFVSVKAKRPDGVASERFKKKTKLFFLAGQARFLKGVKHVLVIEIAGDFK